MGTNKVYQTILCFHCTRPPDIGVTEDHLEDAGVLISKIWWILSPGNDTWLEVNVKLKIFFHRNRIDIEEIRAECAVNETQNWKNRQIEGSCRLQWLWEVPSKTWERFWRKWRKTEKSPIFDISRHLLLNFWIFRHPYLQKYPLRSLQVFTRTCKNLISSGPVQISPGEMILGGCRSTKIQLRPGGQLRTSRMGCSRTTHATNRSD